MRDLIKTNYSRSFFFLQIVCLSYLSLFLVYLISFYYYYLDSCLFSKERKRDVDSDGKGRKEELGGGGEFC